MARGNSAYISFNRGIVSPKALARVDVEHTRLSAEVMTNWLPKTQGAMTLRPGTKYLGSSYNDTGAEFIEFVAASDSGETALVELTHQKMRIWLSPDANNSAFESPVQAGVDVLLARPAVDTVLELTDTGWSNTSTGGALTGAQVDILPTMTAATTDGVTISASSENVSNTTAGIPDNDMSHNRSAWKAADDSATSGWQDTGHGNSRIPSTWQVDFGSGNERAITSYSIKAGPNSFFTDNVPSVWQFQYSDNGSAWTTTDTQGSETGWAVGEKRTYTTPEGDTGTVTARRYWRFNFTSLSGDTELIVAEIELFTAAAAQQVRSIGTKRAFNASSIGGLARYEKRVMVSDTGTEHSLALYVSRGPIIIRVGSTQRDDDYVRESLLGTGYHNLAFTPTGNFWVTLQSDRLTDSIVDTVSIGDSGTVELTTFIDSEDLDGVRYDQSADVVYVDSPVHPCKIERRGTGRSWSFVKYQPETGPFLPFASSSAKLRISKQYGNTDMSSDIPFFTADHVGALVRAFNASQSGVWALGAKDAATDAIRVTGISDTGDTGSPSQGSERRITVSVTGNYSGRLRIERSFEGEGAGFQPVPNPRAGFHPVSFSRGYLKGATTTDTGLSDDTGTFTRVINDPDDNSIVWYRVRMLSYTSGGAFVQMTYPHGGVNGVARVTGFNSNTNVDVEVLSRFADTGPSAVWQEGAWSDRQGYPTAVALHSGRLGHAGRSNIWMSVSDDYENFDDETIGDAGPISRTLGSGPVDSINYLLSTPRLLIGTAGAELQLKTSNEDEPVTPTNCVAKTVSTQGSAGVRAVKMDQSGLFVHRSGRRLFMIGEQVVDLSILVPELKAMGVVSIAVQRQPDTRIHCVLSDGRVAILTLAVQDVLCWTIWETLSGDAVEKAMVLPGTPDDRVYYHVRRTINGVTKRYLERWATEDECLGDTGLSWLADCAKRFTDTGRTASLTGYSHLNGESVIAWADDTGQSYHGKDLSYDTGGVQKTYTVSAGGITLSEAVHHAVAGLPYSADWKSTKLAYSGDLLTQMKRVEKIAFVLYKTHNSGIYFGNDTGALDPLPRKIDGGAEVDPRKIYETFDKAAMAFPGLWNEDSRIVLRAKAPRPATVLAAIPTVETNER